MEFVVTGPTGSGKTTTLYSCLRRVNTIDSKLLTAEDPWNLDIEAHHAGRAINEAAGMTFGKALRSFLRQDLDIIMVGEMRDLETAQISVQARPLTGHLVLSTLHTNDSPGASRALVDMGVESIFDFPDLLGVCWVSVWCDGLQKLPDAVRADGRDQLAMLNLSPHDLGDKVFHYAGAAARFGK